MPLLPPIPHDAHRAAARPRVIPTLYATPEPKPLPETAAPCSFPPSPYVVNHKRRGPRLLKTLSHSDVAAAHPPQDATSRLATSKSFSEGDVVSALGNGVLEVGEKEVEVDGKGEGALAEAQGGGRGEGGGEVDDFFDPRESMSVGSSTGNAEEEANGRWKGGPLSSAEYYDAFEEIYSEGIGHSPRRNIESDLHELRLNLLMEIDRRKQAEDSLENLQNYWQILSNQLALVGINLPALSSIMDDKTKDSCADSTEELRQQVMLARLVAESIGRGSARAEVEMEMETQIDAKNFEIARLLDRLHYYEAANHEMSQRNQEAVELARRQRQRRKRQQRWVWGSMGLAIVIGGVAAAAWSRYHALSLPASSEGTGSTNHEHN